MRNRTVLLFPMTALGLLSLNGCTLPRMTRTVAEPLRLHTGRYGHAVVADQQRIYVVGGSGRNGFLGDIEAIDPVRGTSKVLTTGLIPRRYLSAVLVEGQIYILGGVNSKGYEPTVEVFDIETGHVSHAPPLPTPRLLAKAVALGNRVYVIGGASEQGSERRRRTGLVEVFDVESQCWDQAAAMETARECALAVANGRIFAIGGYAGGEEGLRAFESFDPSRNQWTTLKDLPFVISAHSAVGAEDRIFTFGDYKQLDRVAMYDLSSERWSLLDVGYEPSRHNAAVVFRDEIFAVGGNVASTGSHLDRVQRFRIEELISSRAKP